MTSEYLSGDSIWTIVSAVGSLVAIIWGVIVYRKNAQKEREEKRSEYLEKLIDSFSKNRVLGLVSISDASDGTDAFFEEMSKQIEKDSLALGKNREIVEQTLRFIEWVLYLKGQKQISKDEFSFFEKNIRCILEDPNMQKYISGEGYGPSAWTEGRWTRILSFMNENHLGSATFTAMSDDTSDDAEEVKRADIQETVCEDQQLELKDFDQPTMVIKINKKYHEGMSDDDIFEAVSKEWVINPQKANQYHLVLAVAFGIVRGVYICDHWESSHVVSRSYFVRGTDREKEELLSRRYKGKSVRNLFSQGAANPIRYFNPQ